MGPKLHASGLRSGLVRAFIVQELLLLVLKISL